MSNTRQFALGLLVLLGCRDEQAGPKHRPADSPAAPAVYDSLPNPLTYVANATLGGGAIEYLGSRVEPEKPQAGQQVKLSHYFRAVRTPPKGYGFFLHVSDAGSGAMLGNADHEFAGGALPIGSWPVGKIVEDVHTIGVPPQLGVVRVMLGFWQGNDRLPVDQPDKQDGQNRVLGPLLDLVPTYTAKQTAQAPKVDGKLDEPFWQSAQPAVLVQSFNGTNTPVKTTLRMAYDAKFLYVGMEAEDADVWGTLLKRDEPIYTQEAMEVFIDADGNGATYNELEVSPNNTLFDAYFPKRREGMDLTYDSGMRSAVQVRGTLNQPSDRDEGWTVELAIPVEKLSDVHGPLKAGTTWRFNAYRLEMSDRKQQDGQAFSSLHVGDFHHVPRFAHLNFE